MAPAGLGSRHDAPLGLAVRRPRLVAWSLIASIIGIVAVGLLLHMGGMLSFLFPSAAFFIGAILFRYYPDYYIGYTWWLWFLTPELRRLVDFQVGWNPSNPIMLAPFLVTALAGITMLRHAPKLRRRAMFPFILVIGGVFLAYLIGLVFAGLTAASYDLLNWLVPILFAGHIALCWRDYPRHRDIVFSTFKWGLIATGGYGVWQFFALPAWDQTWMINSEMRSIGQPFPFLVRVFGPMNAPAPFAVVLMAGLLLNFADRSRQRWVAAGLGYASLLVSLVRSAWGGWLIGLMVFAARSPGSLRLRLTAVILLLSALMVPLMSIGPIADVLNTRFETLSNIETDTSLQVRIAFYQEFAKASFSNPLGMGLGSSGLSTKLANNQALQENLNFDSGLMNLGFVLGWQGMILYLGGAVWLLIRVMSTSKRSPHANVYLSICIATFAQLIFANTLVGVQGMVFWSFLGLSLSARHYMVEPLGDPRVQERYPQSKLQVTNTNC